MFVGAVGHVEEALVRVLRERNVPHRAVRQRVRRHEDFLHELAFLREDLDAVVDAVAGVDEAVVRNLGAVHRVRELLRRCLAGLVARHRQVGRRLAVRAPNALDLAVVEVDDRDAVVQVTVRDVAFVRLRIDEDLGDAAVVVHVLAVGDIAGLRTGGRSGLEVRVLAGAGLAVLRHELAVARELQDVRVVRPVAADPHETLVVDHDAVVRLGPLVATGRVGTAPAAHQVAGRIEFEHRRRRDAAFADARTGRRRLSELGAVETGRAGIVAAMNQPYVVAIVHGEADGLTEYPVVGHRFRPERIHFKFWCLLGLRRHVVEQRLPRTQCEQYRDKRRAYVKLAISHNPIHLGSPSQEVPL